MMQQEITITSAEEYGPAIRRIREARGLSQEQLAQLMGIDQRTISRWEVGPNLVNPVNFLKVITALDSIILIRY